MPQLILDPAYKILKQHKRREVVDNIRQIAKELLCESGYAGETVDKIFRNNK